MVNTENKPGEQISSVRGWQGQLQSNARLAILIICVIGLVYLIITIIGLSKINIVLNEEEQQRANYEKIDLKIEKLYEQQSRVK